MFRISIIIMVLSLSIMAKNFNFTELRYSDAIGKTIELQGQITFSKDGLSILYPKSKRALKYFDDTLLYELNNEVVELDFMQQQYMIQYFEILILLHNGDESSLGSEFDINKKQEVIVLTPKGTLKNYINKIELFKENKLLEYVKLYLNNNDSIMITIHDKVK